MASDSYLSICDFFFLWFSVSAWNAIPAVFLTTQHIIWCFWSEYGWKVRKNQTFRILSRMRANNDSQQVHMFMCVFQTWIMIQYAEQITFKVWSYSYMVIIFCWWSFIWIKLLSLFSFLYYMWGNHYSLKFPTFVSNPVKQLQ